MLDPHNVRCAVCSEFGERLTAEGTAADGFFPTCWPSAATDQSIANMAHSATTRTTCRQIIPNSWKKKTNTQVL